MKLWWQKLRMNCSKKKAFTLIELLLAITLSAVLMTWIVVFISSSLGSNISVKKTIEDDNKNSGFEQKFVQMITSLTGSGYYSTGTNLWSWYLTGIFLSTYNSRLPGTFIWLLTQTGYCDKYGEWATETGTVMKLAIRQFSTPIPENNGIGYTLSPHEHSIFSGSMRIVGMGYPGKNIWTLWTETELSFPNALLLSGSHLYIADTGNDRILSYNINTQEITELLGPDDKINKPTSLYFSGSTLLIASTGNGKIYSLQDGDEDSGSILKNSFRVAKDFSANMIWFTFSWIPIVISPTVYGSFTLTGVSWVSVNDLVSTGAMLQYVFSGGSQNFSRGDQYQFQIKNISPTIINTLNNSVTISFFNSWTLQYSDTFHHFNKGDGSLESKTGNILKTLSWGLVYPHSITGENTWENTLDWNVILTGNPEGFENISELPLQDFSTQISGKILTIKYHEYTHYDCINGKHIITEKIYKTLLP